MEHSIRKCATIASVLALCGLAPVSSVMAQTFNQGTTNIQGGPSPFGTSSTGSTVIGQPAAGAPKPLVFASPLQPLPSYPKTPAATGNQLPSAGIPPLPVGFNPSALQLYRNSQGQYAWMLKPNPTPAPTPAAAAPRPYNPRKDGYGAYYAQGPCGASTYGAVMSPCTGPVGTVIRLQLQKYQPIAPASLMLKAPIGATPARIPLPLSGSGSSYMTASTPPGVCTAGGGTWFIDLVLADGSNAGQIGSFTPTNCR